MYIRGYKAKVKRAIEEGRKLHRPARDSFGERARRKLTSKSNWFRKPRVKSGGGLPSRRGARENKEAELRTSTVMFIPRTSEGALINRLRGVERDMRKVVGSSMRLVERAGTHLKSLLVKSNPWASNGCGREMCTSCSQEKKGGECSRRSVVYKTTCMTCMREGTCSEYIGETGRCLRERMAEHTRDASNKDPKSHMETHRVECHPETEKAEDLFAVKVVKTTQSALERQISEAVLISEYSGDRLLNDKFEYSRCLIPKITVKVGQKVEEDPPSHIYTPKDPPDTGKRGRNETSDMEMTTRGPTCPPRMIVKGERRGEKRTEDIRITISRQRIRNKLQQFKFVPKCNPNDYQDENPLMRAKKMRNMDDDDVGDGQYEDDLHEDRGEAMDDASEDGGQHADEVGGKQGNDELEDRGEAMGDVGEDGGQYVDDVGDGPRDVNPGEDEEATMSTVGGDGGQHGEESGDQRDDGVGVDGGDQTDDVDDRQHGDDSGDQCEDEGDQADEVVQHGEDSGDQSDGGVGEDGGDQAEYVDDSLCGDAGGEDKGETWNDVGEDGGQHGEDSVDQTDDGADGDRGHQVDNVGDGLREDGLGKDEGETLDGVCGEGGQHGADSDGDGQRDGLHLRIPDVCEGPHDEPNDVDDDKDDYASYEGKTINDDTHLRGNTLVPTTKSTKPKPNDDNTYKPKLKPKPNEEDNEERKPKPFVDHQPNHLSVKGKRVILEVKIPKRGPVSKGVMKGASGFSKSKMKTSKHVSIESYFSMGEGRKIISDRIKDGSKPILYNYITGNIVKTHVGSERNIGLLNDLTHADQPRGCDEMTSGNGLDDEGLRNEDFSN